jgi:hypothetical protein
MKKINYIILSLIILLNFGLSISPAHATESTPTTTACEAWANDNQNHNGKVCTDLLEGIPCSTLEGGRCTENNCVKQEGNICKAVISPTGITSFMYFISMIYRYGSWAIGILAVLMIIIGGITMSIGGASQESVNKGKKIIMQAIEGVILFFLIGVILHTINPNFF